MPAVYRRRWLRLDALVCAKCNLHKMKFRNLVSSAKMVWDACRHLALCTLTLSLTLLIARPLVWATDVKCDAVDENLHCVRSSACGTQYILFIESNETEKKNKTKQNRTKQNIVSNIEAKNFVCIFVACMLELDWIEM